MYELESQNVTNSSFYLFNFILKIKCLLNVLTRVYADCTEAQRAQITKTLRFRRPKDCWFQLFLFISLYF